MIDFFKNSVRRLCCFFQKKKYQCAGRTDTGRVRQKNEDAFHLMEDRGVFLVADGMGGHNAGEIASRVAIETLADFFSKTWFCSVFNNPEEIRHTLIKAFRQANEKVIKVAASDEDFNGMGCTLVACLVEGNRLHSCHVGDARCYLADDQGLKQITNDHTILAGFSDETLTSQTSSTVLPPRHIVTRAIGFPFPEDPEYHCQTLTAGNKLLLCSDGLWSMVDHDHLYRALKESKSPQSAVTALVDMANDAGGTDNITAVVIFC